MVEEILGFMKETEEIDSDFLCFPLRILEVLFGFRMDGSEEIVKF